MEYIEKIESVIKNVNKELLDLNVEREKYGVPTQVSSEFLTNKEQGDWAEKTFIKGINDFSKNYIAVKYGRDDDIIAGETGFAEFYRNYQHELDEIGKRPDVLIFNKKDFPYDTDNICRLSQEELDLLVPKAKCGIEIRSSSFLYDKYNAYMQGEESFLFKKIFDLKENIINNFSELLLKKNPELHKIISALDKDNISVVSYRAPSWKSSQELSQLSSLLKELKLCLTKIQTRKFLSITPKVEDLKVVYNWVKRYNVPHYYLQVFFDKAYGISYEEILTLLCDEEAEGRDYFIESDVKNQNKTTIKIKPDKGKNILQKVSLPEHKSKMKELGRGRLLFYVTFEKSIVQINTKGFEELFGFSIE